MADRKSAARLHSPSLQVWLERAKGFEPSTTSLGSFGEGSNGAASRVDSGRNAGYPGAGETNPLAPPDRFAAARMLLEQAARAADPRPFLEAARALLADSRGEDQTEPVTKLP